MTVTNHNEESTSYTSLYNLRRRLVTECICGLGGNPSVKYLGETCRRLGEKSEANQSTSIAGRSFMKICSIKRQKSGHYMKCSHVGWRREVAALNVSLDISRQILKNG